MSYRFQMLKGFLFASVMMFTHFLNGQVAPTTQESNIKISPGTAPVILNSLRFDWTAGNGSARIVVICSNGGSFTPADGTSYTANTNFGSGTDLDPGTGSAYCVFSGTGTNVTVFNLTNLIDYTVKVYGYNGTGSGIRYNTNGTTYNPLYLKFFGSSNTYNVPSNVSYLFAQLWGGGGSGGGHSGSGSGGGGGGGSYNEANLTVTPSSAPSVIVGVGGAGSSTSGLAGTPSSFTTLSANPGGPGGAGPSGAPGPASTLGTKGGDGGTGSGGGGSASGGGGGSSGGSFNGTSIPGMNGSNGMPGGGSTAPGGTISGGGTGGTGASNASGTALDGFIPGGGGAGAGGGGGGTSGKGGNGLAIISYGEPSISFASLDYNSGTMTVQFSETVSTVDATKFHINDATGTDYITLTPAELTSVSGAVATFTLTENHRYQAIIKSGTTGGDGGAVILDVDALGAQSSLGNYNSQDDNNKVSETADTTAPSVSSINIITPPTPNPWSTTNGTSATTVTFRVTFNEAVTGSFATQLGVMASGDIAWGSFNATPFSSTQVDITIGGITGTGVIRCDYFDIDGVFDTAGNPVGGSGVGNGDFITAFTGNQYYTIVLPAPSSTVSSFSSTGASSTTIDLQWNHAVAPAQDPTHYVVIANETPTGPGFPSVGDGTPLADDTDATDGRLLYNVVKTAGTTQPLAFTNLKTNTTYDFRIYPYTFSQYNTSDNIDYGTFSSITGVATTGSNPNLTIAPLSAGLAPSPLIANSTDQAILGFSLTSDGSQTVTDLAVNFTGQIIGKFSISGLIRSVDNDFSTSGDNTVINGLSIMWVGNPTILGINGMNEVITSAPSNYFITANIESAVTGTTPSEQALNMSATVSTGTISGSASGPLYTFSNGCILPTLNTITSNNTSCAGANGNALVTATTAGGSEPSSYTMIWHSGSLTGTIVAQNPSVSPGTAGLTASSLAAGSYFAEVINNDIGGCSSNTSVIIIDDLVLPNLAPTTNPATTCLPPNGSASVTATTPAPGSEPAGGYTYAWFDAGLNPLGVSTSTLSSVVGADYHVQVTNNDTGCQNSILINVADNTIIPTITLGVSPTVSQGTTTANLTYSGVTGSPNQYTIDFNTAAETAGFLDIAFTTLPASPITITVPGAAAAATYNASIAVRNSTTQCTNAAVPFTISVTPPPAPVITAVSIPNVTMKVGDIVTATITVNSSTEVFTLSASTIGGFALSNLIKSNNTTYTAQFTILNGGSDIIASSSIPVSVVLTGVGGSNTPFTTAIAQPNDPIDANIPAPPTIPDLNVADDTGASGTDNITNLTSALTFGGTAEIGATINIYRAGSTLIGTGIATGGSYTIDVALPVGTHTITAVTTDAAGNVGPASSGLSVTVDNTPPSVTLNQAGGQPDPASTLPVNFTAVFSEAINPASFASADFTFNGTAPGQTLGTLSTSDNITWTVPLNATGSGTFTPLINAGGIQDVAGNNNNGSTSTDNSVTYNNAPTVQASNIIFSTITTTSLTLNWTNGNGASRLVLAKASSAVDAVPVNATGSYTASATFGSGSQLGTGNFIVFIGATNSVTVTGLTAGTTYHFQVFEFNNPITSASYLTTTSTGNPNSSSTLATQPTTQAASIVFSNVTSTSMDVTWTNGNGTSRFVMANTPNTTSFTPTDGTTYTFNSDYSLAPTTTNGDKTVYVGTGNTFTLTGLTPSTTYAFKIFEFNGTGASANYMTTGPNGNQATLASTGTTTISLLTNGVAPSPLLAGSLGQAVLGFSLASSGSQTLTAANIPLSSDPSGKLLNWSLVSSLDNSYSTSGDNLLIGGLTFTPTVSQLGITGLNEALSATPKNYFLVADVNSAVTSSTPTIQVTLGSANLIFNSGVATGTATGINYLFVAPAPVITAVAIPNVSMKIGSVVTTTITVNSSVEVFTLGTSNIGGFALSGLSKASNTSYTAQFTVTSGGTDVAAGSNIPLSVILAGSGGNSTAFTTAISQNADPIDANAPVFSATAPATSATVSNTQVSYTLSEAITSGSITWTQTGGTTDANSPHVQTLSGTELTSGAKTNITLTNNPTLVNGSIYSIAFSGTDAAGNTATVVTNTNITYSVATAPVITAVSIPNVSMKIGDVVTATITVNSNTEAFTLGTSNVGGFALGTLVKSNNTTYTAQFTITSSGTDVAAGSNIPISVVLTGVAGSNTPFTTAIAQASDPIDANRPAYSAVAPATNATVSNTQVSYTLSENLSAGSITWTRTGGTADPNSPIARSLTGSELTAGTKTNITITNNPTLVSGAIYTIAFNGQDAAGNAATQVSSTNVTYSVASVPVITGVSIPNVSMKIGDVVTATITVNTSTEAFTLSASTIGGFPLTNLVKASNTSYTAQFTITQGGTDVIASSNIPVNLILTGLAGNSIPFTTAIVQASDPIDANRPIFSATAPASNATVSTTQVSYTLSEALTSGTITWTRTGGTADPNAHVQNLTGAELASGPHANITLTNNPTLVNGTIYSIAYAGTDAAGNTATVVTNTNITFNSDTTPPTVTSINYQTPANALTNATSLTFRVTFSEAVTNVDAADFTKSLAGGVAGGSITVTPVSTSVYDVTFTVAGSGTVRLDVLSTASINDTFNNAYSANFTGGQVYTLDQTPPVFSNTAPSSTTTVNGTQVGYTLSENLSTGTITWTRTGGTADATVHTQALATSELTVGPHPNFLLTNSPTLVAGAVYSIAFSGVDLAGNSSTTVTNTNITYVPTANKLSDIIANASFTYSQNIAYVNFQESSDLTSTSSVAVAKFDIRDGGATLSDIDPHPTVITALEFLLGGNSSVLRRIALYDASGAEVSGSDKAVSGQTVSFTGLSLSCPDNSALSFTLRVSFVATVADNAQFDITLTRATYENGKSELAETNGGGPKTSTAGNDNRIEVTATELKFVLQPSGTLINDAMDPSPSLEAVDANGNLDVDFTGSVGVTSSGTLGGSATASFTSGIGIFSTITHTASGTDLTLTTTNNAGLTNAVSSLFDIYSETNQIPIVIHSLITPSSADDQNNVLYIDNIDYFPENSVRLLDRWGVTIKDWSNFSNYTSSDPGQSDFDFSSLNVGNYICIVQYKDSATGNKKSQSQMITVLK